MCNTSITFNQISRQYEIRDGNDQVIAEYDYTQPNNAHQHHLQLSDPDTHNAARYLAADLFRHNPDMQERIWSAAYIVARNGVRPPYYLRDPLDVFRVREHPPSLKRPSTRTDWNPNPHLAITPFNGRLHCPCFDYRDNQSAPKIDGHPMCIHILAIKIQKMLHRSPTTWHIDESYTSRERAKIMQDIGYIEMHGLPPESLLIIDNVQRRATEHALKKIAERVENPADCTEIVNQWCGKIGLTELAKEHARRADVVIKHRNKAEEESSFTGISYTWPTMAEELTS